MSIMLYLKERMVFLIINFLMFLLVTILMRIALVPINIIVLVFIIWFGPLVIYMVLEIIKFKRYLDNLISTLDNLDKKYLLPEVIEEANFQEAKIINSAYMVLEIIKFKRYLDNLISTLDNLDKKYLLPEVIEEANFQEAKIINSALKECNKAMHEKVKYYKDEQIEYREYIETWVHEIKTPIASAKLILDNDDSNSGEKISYEMKRVEGFIEEYREYIETWVHEIKTPIASAKLILDNDDSNSGEKISYEMKRVEGFIEQALYYARSNDVSKDYIIKEFDLRSVVMKAIKSNSRDFINRKIKQALYYARSNDVSKDYIIKEFDLRSVVMKAIKSNSRDFINRKIKLNIKDIDGTIFSDAKWVEFIVNQIIINAVKFSKSGSGEVSIYSKVNENNIILTIEDNGVGINEKDIDRVFEKGFTGDNGRKFGKSTGIGLYLCKKLCEKLGIGISLDSKENEGTKVNIIFPQGRFTDF